MTRAHARHACGVEQGAVDTGVREHRFGAFMEAIRDAAILADPQFAITAVNLQISCFETGSNIALLNRRRGGEA